MKSKLFGLAAAGIVAVGIVVAVSASTASNTVPTSKSGEGQGTITGYDISTVHYGLNASDPTKVDSVTFTLDSAPAAGSTVKVKLNSASSSWYTCTNTGTSVTCATTSPQATIATANQLNVVVAQ